MIRIETQVLKNKVSKKTQGLEVYLTLINMLL